MSEYLIRKVNHFYELAKFEETDSPTAVYKITDRGCTCPSRYKNCKHQKIFTAWKRAGEIVGQVLDDEGKVIGQLHVQ